jgi:hypothetical protein
METLIRGKEELGEKVEERSKWGIDVMVACVLCKDDVRVRFSYAPPKKEGKTLFKSALCQKQRIDQLGQIVLVILKGVSCRT